jgi:hypothetical protein
LYKAFLIEGGVAEVADEFGLSVPDVQAAVRFEIDLNERTLHFVTAKYTPRSPRRSSARGSGG